MVFPARSVHWLAHSCFLSNPFFIFLNFEAIMTVLSKAFRSQSFSCQQSFKVTFARGGRYSLEGIQGFSNILLPAGILPKLVHLTCFSVVSSEHMVASEPWGKCLYFTCKAAAVLQCRNTIPALLLQL